MQLAFVTFSNSFICIKLNIKSWRKYSKQGQAENQAISKQNNVGKSKIQKQQQGRVKNQSSEI